MRELQLWETDSVVGDTFSDITELGAGCRFRDCLHDREPGCAVKAAVEAGTLDAGRYESYLKLQAEEEATRKLRDEKALLDEKAPDQDSAPGAAGPSSRSRDKR